MPITIQGRERVYKGWTSLSRVTLSDGTASFTREVEDHGVAAAVLPYDAERRVALVVTMPRAPVLLVGAPDLIEVPAGLVDPGEVPETTARREAKEETGVELGPLDLVGTVWACPGLSTDRITLFLGAYGRANRTGAGGGLAHENENIVVAEMALPDLAARLDAGHIGDLKTFALLQTLRLRRPELFSA